MFDVLHENEKREREKKDSEVEDGYLQTNGHTYVNRECVAMICFHSDTSFSYQRSIDAHCTIQSRDKKDDATGYLCFSSTWVQDFPLRVELDDERLIKRQEP